MSGGVVTGDEVEAALGPDDRHAFGARTARARKRRSVLLPIVPLAVITLLSLFYVLISQTSPDRLHLALAWAGPSWASVFGYGAGGVDLTALVLNATLRTLGLAAWVTAFGWVVGTTLGTAAGLARGALERWVLRAADLVQAFPTFLLALAVLAAVQIPSRWHIGAVFCLAAWAPFARIALVQARVLTTSPFVDAARALGCSRPRIVLRHVLPNLLGPVSVQIGTSAAGIVLGEAALGFIGLGPPDGVSLGSLLEQGTDSMLFAPHVLAVGAVAIALCSGSMQLASEGVRRAVGVK